MSTYCTITQTTFLAQRRDNLQVMRAYAAAHPEMNILILDSGDDIVCDGCNGNAVGEDGLVYVCTAMEEPYCTQCRQARLT